MGFFSNIFEPTCEAAIRNWYGVRDWDYMEKTRDYYFDCLYEGDTEYDGDFDLREFADWYEAELDDCNVEWHHPQGITWKDVEKSIMLSINGYNGHTITYEDFCHWAYAGKHERG